MMAKKSRGMSVQSMAGLDDLQALLKTMRVGSIEELLATYDPLTVQEEYRKRLQQELDEAETAKDQALAKEAQKLAGVAGHALPTEESRATSATADGPTEPDGPRKRRNPSPETRKTWKDEAKRKEILDWARKAPAVSLPAPIDPYSLPTYVLPGLEKKSSVVAETAQATGSRTVAKKTRTSANAAIGAVLARMAAQIIARKERRTELLKQHMAIGGRGQQKAEYAAKVLIYDDFVTRVDGGSARWVGTGAWAPLTEVTEMLKHEDGYDPYRILLATGEMGRALHPETGAYDPPIQVADAFPPELTVGMSDNGGKNKWGGHQTGKANGTARPWKPMSNEWTAEAKALMKECIFSADELAAIEAKAAEGK